MEWTSIELDLYDFKIYFGEIYTTIPIQNMIMDVLNEKMHDKFTFRMCERVSYDVLSWFDGKIYSIVSEETR